MVMQYAVPSGPRINRRLPVAVIVELLQAMCQQGHAAWWSPQAKGAVLPVAMQLGHADGVAMQYAVPSAPRINRRLPVAVIVELLEAVC